MKGCERGSPKCALHHIISCTFICKDMVKTKPKKKRKQLEMLGSSSAVNTTILLFINANHLLNCPVMICSRGLNGRTGFWAVVSCDKKTDTFFISRQSLQSDISYQSVVVVVVVWESHLNWPDVSMKHWVDKSLSLKEAETLKFITSPTTP